MATRYIMQYSDCLNSPSGHGKHIACLRNIPQGCLPTTTQKHSHFNATDELMQMPPVFFVGQTC